MNIKKVIICVASVVLIAIIVTFSIVYYFVPNAKYNHANDLLADGKLSEAEVAFSEIINYKDSHTKYQECLYLKAVSLRNEKKWELANEIFNEIPDYKDSKELIHIHSFSESEVKNATCTEMGIKQYVCSCGETKKESIKALGHDYCEATCTSPRKCSRCGITDGKALGHNDTWPECSRCGIATSISKGKQFTITGSGKKVYNNFYLPSGTYLIYYRCSFDYGFGEFLVHTSNKGYLFDKLGSGINQMATYYGSIDNCTLEIDGGEHSTWSVRFYPQ